jgi:6-phosphogluconolactonase
VTIDATGSFAYVANFRSDTVSVFKIDHCSGSLGALQSLPTGGVSPIAVTLDPHERFLFVTNTASNNVSAFAVGGHGMLTAVPGSPFASAASTQGLAVSSSGEFLYVTAGFGVLGYTIGASGRLAALAGSPFHASGFLVSLTLDKTGHFLYAADSAAGVDAFRLDPATGNLTAVTGSPFIAGSNTFSVATTMAH